MAETGKTAPTQNVRHLDKNNLFLCLDTLRAGDAAGRILNAYWLSIALLAYVLFYVLVGSKVSKS